MKKLYLLLGLIEHHEIRLNITREIFISVLKTKVGSDSASSLDIFSGSKYEYRGAVGPSGFYLRRTRGFMTNNRHHCKAFGTFREENNPLLIDLEFRNFPPPVYFYLVLVPFFLFFTVVNIVAAIFTLNTTNLGSWTYNLFTGGFFALAIGYVIRSFSHNTIRKMKFEMENNFQEYLTKKV